MTPAFCRAIRAMLRAARDQRGLVGVDRFDQLLITGAGPHTIGGATDADIGLNITGDLGAGVSRGTRIEQTTRPAAGASSYGLSVTPALTEAGSGVHPLLAGAFFAPSVTAGAATVTTLAGLATGALTAQTGTSTAAAIYVRDAPTGATDNYGLLVDSGNVRIDDILTVGTSLLTGTSAGDVVMNVLRARNDAGNNTIALIRQTSDTVVLSPGGTDIRWGVALVALGGGAAPTLGTIGGSGPATAGQNTWMRVLDSTGAAFFVPAWK